MFSGVGDKSGDGAEWGKRSFDRLTLYISLSRGTDWSRQLNGPINLRQRLVMRNREKYEM